MPIPAIATGEFTASAELASDTIQVRLAGHADLRVRDPMSELLTQLHAEAQRLKTREVTVDLRDLESMSSSCFQGFVTWLGRLVDLEPASQYQIRFLSNSGRHWQRRSLGALSCFAVDLVRVET